jgi:hypothetical protein
MNTANLQLEGLYMALVALMGVLKDKGLVSEAEVERALAEAEAAVIADPVARDRPPANLHAVRFPIRLLRRANADPQTFSALARGVGTDIS